MTTINEQPLTLDHLVRRAVFIVVAEFSKLLSSEVVTYGRDSRVESLARFSVLDHVKGGEQPKGLTLRFIGGTVEDEATDFVHELVKGQPYLLVLAKDAGSGKRKIYVPINGCCLPINAMWMVPVIPELQKEVRKLGLTVRRGKTEWMPLRKIMESRI